MNKNTLRGIKLAYLAEVHLSKVNKTKMTVDNFDQKKTNFLVEIEATLVEIEATVKMEDILPEMVFNWAQTRIHLVSRSSWTMEKQGAKYVECVGMMDCLNS